MLLGSLQRIVFEGDDLAAVPLFTAAIPFVRFVTAVFGAKRFDSGIPRQLRIVETRENCFCRLQPGSPRGQKERFKEVEGASGAVSTGSALLSDKRANQSNTSKTHFGDRNYVVRHLGDAWCSVGPLFFFWAGVSRELINSGSTAIGLPAWL